MTELNQNPMNTNQRSKAPLVLFIVCILVLAIVGGYFAYAKRSWTDSKITNSDTANQTNSVTNNASTDNSTTANNSTDTDISINTQIPSGWVEHELTSCGIRISVPTDWTTENNLSDKTLIFNSPNSIENKKKDWLTQGPSDIADDLQIRCYESLGSMTIDSWKKIQQSYPEFSAPVDLYDALTRKDPTGSFTVFTTQDVEKNQIGEKDVIRAVEGGEIMMTNYYFQNTDGQIVEFQLYINSADGILKTQSPQNILLETFDWL